MGRSILVIDDDFFMRKLMEVLLRNDGHDVFVASDVSEAREILAKNPIEIITCDIMMPNVDGLGFLRHIKGDADHSKIPVIIITAAGDKQIIQEAIEIGAQSVLEKPFTDEDLKNLIQNAFP